jgi:hypothetical protein
MLYREHLAKNGVGTDNFSDDKHSTIKIHLSVLV